MSDNPTDEVLRRVLGIEERLERQNMTDHDMLIRLNTMSDQIVLTLKDIRNSHDSQMAALENRIGALEQARWMMLGAASVIGALASIAVEFFRR